MEGEDAWLTVNDTSSFSVTCTGPPCCPGPSPLSVFLSLWCPLTETQSCEDAVREAHSFPCGHKGNQESTAQSTHSGFLSSSPRPWHMNTNLYIYILSFLEREREELVEGRRNSCFSSRELHSCQVCKWKIILYCTTEESDMVCLGESWFLFLS